MIKLSDITRIYFIGIGGIGMSALARYFNNRGVVVSGYDKTKTVLTNQLSSEGINIHYDDSIDLLDAEAQVVVITPAVPANHLGLNWYRNNATPVMKRSQVLGIITEGSFNICVAGTHGKTSISTMVGHLLRHTGYGCNAFLGGVSVNYETNFWASEKDVCVIEADEFDRSFLTLSPDISVVSSMDPDHLDIYETGHAMEDAFVDFAAKTKSTGILLRKHSLSRLNEAQVRRQLTYVLVNEDRNKEDQPDIYADNILTDEHGYQFDAIVSGRRITGLRLMVGGLHNIENMLVAISVGMLLNIDVDKIMDAVATYKGVKRRFQYILREPGKPVFIDDYAHHPAELEALLKSVRGIYPGRKITILFQPHLYSRTRDFADGFAMALGLADETILLPIYPARELPIEGVESSMIQERMKQAVLCEKDSLLNLIKNADLDVLVAAGAGDIDVLIPSIKEILEQKTIKN